MAVKKGRAPARKKSARRVAAKRPVAREAALKRAANQVALQVSHAEGRAHGRRLKALGQGYLRQLGLEGCELSVSLVGDEEIHQLNRAWRHKDKPTDVLSFPAGDMPPGTPGPRHLGDIVISLDTAHRQALEYGRTVQAELARYLAHGLLHLLGYDHERPQDARKMAAREEALLGARGMVGDSVDAG